LCIDASKFSIIVGGHESIRTNESIRDCIRTLGVAPDIAAALKIILLNYGKRTDF
jgi:hypothetical protein